MNPKPKCIIVTGRPGSGKTTLAKELGRWLHMPVISRDEIKEGYVNTYGVGHDELPLDTNRVVSTLFFELVNHYLVGKVSLIIEAAFQHHVWASQLPRILELGSAFIIVCSVDSMIAAERHLKRGLENASREFYHGDEQVAVYRERGVRAAPEEYLVPEFDVPTIHVATEGEYTPSLADVVMRVQLLGMGDVSGEQMCG